eukprot:TRINITY_DN375_c0_g1_i1.p1 TRINITY_DN375_c0_g1~~TRINITY_DN375_c0_g1_i1.p1  ORF type:complete len:491 (-),score=137.26 TRINITY_DN375_c0_g1_i1:97-1569(-)
MSSKELLRRYYAKCFPYESYLDWLTYSKLEDDESDSVENDILKRREFDFVTSAINENGEEIDIHSRKVRYNSRRAFKDAIARKQPFRIEIGPIYNENNFVMIEKELVFDLDFDDYDSVRPCSCSGATFCEHCWKLMVTALKTVDCILKDYFDFKHVLWVFSGRRGLHCWVADQVARRYSDFERSALIRILNSGIDAKNVKALTNIHFEMEDKHLKKLFNSFLRTKYKGGEWMFQKNEYLSNLSEFLPPSVLESIMRTAHSSTNEEIWRKIQKLTNDSIQQIIRMNLTWPRLDNNVTKQMGHMLKSPFVIHPKSGLICVPIPDIEKFCPNPELIDPLGYEYVAPSLEQVVAQIDLALEPEELLLKPYLDYFKDFVEKLFVEQKTDANFRKHKSNLPSSIQINPNFAYELSTSTVGRLLNSEDEGPLIKWYEDGVLLRDDLIQAIIDNEVNVDDLVQIGLDELTAQTIVENLRNNIEIQYLNEFEKAAAFSK